MLHSVPNFDFMGRTKLYSAIFSAIMILGSFALLAFKGLNLGLDFTGGTEIEVEYSQPVSLEDVRTTLKGTPFAEASIQHFGRPTEVLIRIPPNESAGKSELGQTLMTALHKGTVDVSLKRVDDVGAQVGEELRDKSGAALIYAIILLLIYITYRFKFKFALGAVLAMMHDPIIILGMFSLTQLHFDLWALAALIAVMGYSLNDTIVVYDRVREKFREVRVGTPAEVMNLAINETLDRTILTSAATLVVVIALAVFGGKLLAPFSWALIVGIIVGTYSSIYVACSITLAMKVSREDFMDTTTEVEKDMP